MVEKVSNALDTGKSVVSPILWIKNNFYTVNHGLLLLKYMHMEYEVIFMIGYVTLKS